jgi:hypothetical protein
MKKYINYFKQNIFIISLILILGLSRLIPHPPNFTPIIALAVMSSFLFRNIFISLGVTIFSMFISDMIIGIHSNMFFVYLPLIIIIIFFNKFSVKLNTLNLILYSFIGSILFFIISNFGVWMTTELYEKNLSGLVNCYIMAIPFFHNTVFSTLLFSFITMLANLSLKKKLI